MNPEQTQSVPEEPQSQPSQPVPEPPVENVPPTDSTSQPVFNPADPMQETPVAPKMPFYRSYWIFAAIYLILPPILGLIILFTGNVFRKQKDGQMLPIKKREKLTLTIISIAIWGFVIFNQLHQGNTMPGWIKTNKASFNSSVDSINRDIATLQTDLQGTSVSAVTNDCKQVLTDVNTARTIPVMPDKVAAGYFSSYLTNLESVANDTLSLAKDQSSTTLVQAVRNDMSKTNTASDNLQARLKVDGLTVTN